MAYRINADKCLGCGSCIPKCPVKAISLQDGVSVINEKECFECGSCVYTCPVDAPWYPAPPSYPRVRYYLKGKPIDQ